MDDEVREIEQSSSEYSRKYLTECFVSIDQVNFRNLSVTYIGSYFVIIASVCKTISREKKNNAI